MKGHKQIYELYERILATKFSEEEQRQLKRIVRKEQLAKAAETQQSHRRSSTHNRNSSPSIVTASDDTHEVKANRLMLMNCKEGVTYKTLLAMYLTFFTSMTISSFGFFTMIFFFEEDFGLSPEKALSTVSLLLFYGMPFNLISSVFSGYIFNRFGRKKPILAGFIVTITALLFIPFVGTIEAVLGLLIVAQITSAWT